MESHPAKVANRSSKVRPFLKSRTSRPASPKKSCQATKKPFKFIQKKIQLKATEDPVPTVDLNLVACRLVQNLVSEENSRAILYDLITKEKSTVDKWLVDEFINELESP